MIRYLYAVAAAVFGISATLMLYYRPQSVWGRWYLIVTIIMVFLCFDATLKARNAMKARKADNAASANDHEDNEGTDADTGAGVDAGMVTFTCKDKDAGADASAVGDENGNADENIIADDDAHTVSDDADSDRGSGAVGSDRDESADIPKHGSEKQAIKNESGDETEAEDAVRAVHHPQE